MKVKTQITFLKKDYTRLRDHLLRGKGADEEAAILTGGVAKSDGFLNLLVQDAQPVPDEFLITKGPAGLTIDPRFIAKFAKICRLEKKFFILAHSHPFTSHGVRFSPIDDGGEQRLYPKLAARALESPIASLVLGHASLDARLWNNDLQKSSPLDRIKIIGKTFEWIIPSSSRCRFGSSTLEMHDRQILALTDDGQQKLQNVRVGIVGLGGIGSQVFQYLAHLGIRDFVLIDKDRIEESNRSRVVGSYPSDVISRLPKVQIMKRLGNSINRDLRISAIFGDVLDLAVTKHLTAVDVIFSCTDSHTSRMVATRIASQYLIPLIDTGIDIQPEGESIRRIGGHIFLQQPDGPCLDCAGILDEKALQAELDASEVRRTYIQGDGDAKAPSVISLNGVIAAQAVNDFLNLVTGYSYGTSGVFRMYDGLKVILRSVALLGRTCRACQSVHGAGDLILLPCRPSQDDSSERQEVAFADS